MAIDKLVDSSQLDNNLTLVANAIRAKGGTSASLTFPTDFVTAINAISGSSVTWENIYSNEVYVNWTGWSDDPNNNCYYVMIPWTELIDQGSVWRITWDGTLYECTATLAGSPDGIPYMLGNNTYNGLEGGNNEPFMLQRYDSNLAIVSPDYGDHTITIQKQISGDNNGYTRTVIVPEQTVTPDSSRQASLSGVTDGFVDASHYIVTLDGVEWYGTCETLWGTNLTVGDVQWFWTTGFDHIYPFGAIYVSGEGLSVAFENTNQHTVKIERIELTGSATLITKSITANGTYSASDDDADGYSEVTVNVPSSAASSWTKIAETTYQVSTTSTSATEVATFITGDNSIYTTGKIVYVRIRDTAGKRNGYFYGTDNFFMNMVLKNNPSSSNTSNYIIRMTWSVGADGLYQGRYGYTTTGYGIYPNEFYANGNIVIYKRYNSSYSKTINGTYKVEVYLLDPAGGVPIFE